MSRTVWPLEVDGMISSHWFRDGHDSNDTRTCPVCGNQKEKHHYVWGVRPVMEDTNTMDIALMSRGPRPIKDLIDATEELLEHYNEDPISKKYSYPTAERLRVAIAKARGEQP